ncbi:MAG: hypothetical protein Q9M89_00755 [Persephonella sp.]|nr:hypothetical protein [Persephonella sp.]
MKPAFILILFFLILFTAELGTAVYLYAVKYGFSEESIVRYIHGSSEEFLQKKSFYGLLELNLPHFTAVFLTLFFIMHIFYFFPLKKFYFFLSAVVFVSAFFNFSSPFLVLFYKELSYLKLLSFFIFISSVVFSICLLIFLTLYKFSKKC